MKDKRKSLKQQKHDSYNNVCCGKTFLSKSNYMRHFKSRDHENQTKFDEFYSNNQIEELKTDIYEGKKNECENGSVNSIFKLKICCNKICKTKLDYMQHLNSKKHTKYLKDTKVSDDIKKFTKTYCCDKLYKTEAGYKKHIESQKHKNYDKYIENVEPLNILDCLFCDEFSLELKDNFEHMRLNHGFKLPFSEYINDEISIMMVLVELIDIEHVCLQCNKQFINRLSVRNHMKDCNHYQMYLVDRILYFYDDIHEQKEITINKKIEMSEFYQKYQNMFLNSFKAILDMMKIFTLKAFFNKN